MLHFHRPAFLLLGLLLPLLAWWWRARRPGALRHSLAEGLRPTLQVRLATWGGLWLRLLALTCIVLAAARPRWPDLKSRIHTEGIAIVMVVDMSGSMATKDFDWGDQKVSRLQAVKQIFRLFVAGGQEGDTKLDGRPTDRIGLVGFGNLPETVCPLTLSHSALLRMVDELKPLPAGEAETNIIDAAIWGVDPLRKDVAPRKVLIVLSDGEHNVKAPPSQWELGKVVQAAKALGIVVYTIDAAGTGLSLGEGDRPPPSVEVRETALQTLRHLAEGTGGQYFRADNSAALLGVYKEIDRKERAEFASQQRRRYHEGYPWLATTAVVLFGLVIALELTWWRRVP